MVTDAQVRRLKKLSKTEQNQEIAAAKAGMDAKTVRKYLRSGEMPSEARTDRNWRTRPDPFAAVWEEIRGLVDANPGLEAKTIFESLQRRNPGQYSEGQLRTLQRRLKHWRGMEGPGKEVFFSQKHIPGRLGQSDFTHMTALEITLGGQRFPHLLYHFVLPYSNWETVSICYSESFESLSDGLQHALWELGGVPLQHQTDRMSTAVNNMSDEREFTARYEALLRHYRLEGRKIQTGKANENGDVEQRHYRLKKAVEQALLLRDSRDFVTVAQYETFVRALLAQLNAGRRQRLAEEMQYLRALPDRKLESAKRERVKVDSGSLVYVDRNTYSVHSRLIGERVEARLLADRVEIWYAGRKVEELPRRCRDLAGCRRLVHAARSQAPRNTNPRVGAKRRCRRNPAPGQFRLRCVLCIRLCSGGVWLARPPLGWDVVPAERPLCLQWHFGRSRYARAPCVPPKATKPQAWKRAISYVDSTIFVFKSPIQ
jgi:hypothetical protein